MSRCTIAFYTCGRAHLSCAVFSRTWVIGVPCVVFGLLHGSTQNWLSSACVVLRDPHCAPCKISPYSGKSTGVVHVACCCCCCCCCCCYHDPCIARQGRSTWSLPCSCSMNDSLIHVCRLMSKGGSTCTPTRH